MKNVVPAALLASAIAASGCRSRPDRVVVALSNLNLDYAVLVVRDASGNTVLNETIALESVAEQSMDLSAENFHELLILGYTKDALAELTPRLDPSRITETLTFLNTEAEACPAEGQVSDDGRSTVLPLPASTRVFEATVENGYVASAVPLDPVALGVNSLRLPITAEICHQKPTEGGRPYGENLTPIPEDATAGGEPIFNGEQWSIGGVFRMDDDRLVVGTTQWLLVLEPGSDFVDRGDNWLKIPSDLFVSSVTGIREGDGYRIYATARNGRFPQPTDAGALYEVTFDAQGFGSISTSTESNLKFDEVVVDPTTGRVVVAERPARMLTRAQPGAPWTSVEVPGDPTSERRLALHYTGIPAGPFVAGGMNSGALYQSNSDASRWDLISDGLDITVATRGFGAYPSGDGFEVLAANRTGAIFHRRFDEPTWKGPVLYTYPPSLAARGCSPLLTPWCGWSDVSVGVYALIVVSTDPLRVIAPLRSCAAVLDLHGSGCATYIPTSFEVQLGLPALDEQKTFDLHYPWLTIPSQSGPIWEFDLRELE